MKRTTSIILILILMLSLCAGAHAAPDSPVPPPPGPDPVPVWVDPGTGEIVNEGDGEPIIEVVDDEKITEEVYEYYKAEFATIDEADTIPDEVQRENFIQAYQQVSTATKYDLVFPELDKALKDAKDVAKKNVEDEAKGTLVSAVTQAQEAKGKEVTKPVAKVLTEKEKAEVKEAQKQVDAVKVDDLVVLDIFNLYIYDDVQHGIDDWYALKITFAMPDIEAGDTFIVYVMGEDGTWQRVAASDIHYNGDGTVTIYFVQVGTVAFLAQKKG